MKDKRVGIRLMNCRKGRRGRTLTMTYFNRNGKAKQVPLASVREPDAKPQDTFISSNMGIRKQLLQDNIFRFFFEYTKLFYNVKYTHVTSMGDCYTWTPANVLLCLTLGQFRSQVDLIWTVSWEACTQSPRVGYRCESKS